jgi:hypothetical protein
LRGAATGSAVWKNQSGVSLSLREIYLDPALLQAWILAILQGILVSLPGLRRWWRNGVMISSGARRIGDAQLVLGENEDEEEAFN